MQYFQISDVLIGIVYFLVMLIIAKIYQKSKENTNTIYRYFFKAYLIKLIAATCFLLVYVYYYKGGDTINYFKSALAVSNLLFKDPNTAISILLGDLSREHYALFNSDTGWPAYYMWLKPKTFSSVRIATLFALFGLNSLWSTTLLVASFSFFACWQLFKTLSCLFVAHTKHIAYSIFLIPSFMFWGSGIMKDTFVISAICIIVFNFYTLFYIKRNRLFHIISLCFFILMIASIKPYIILCLIPALGVWYYKLILFKIRSKLLRYVFMPIILLTSCLITLFSYQGIKGALGVYGQGLDALVAHSKLIQEDLLREEQYGSNNYDLGKIDDIGSMLSNAPMAIFTAIYRPFLFEASNVFMIIAGFENMFLLLFTFLIIIKYRGNVFRMYRIINHNEILYFALIFILILAFGAGITSSNFGALVRYKIPLLPFLYLILFVLYKKANTVRR